MKFKTNLTQITCKIQNQDERHALKTSLYDIFNILNLNFMRKCCLSIYLFGLKITMLFPRIQLLY